MLHLLLHMLLGFENICNIICRHFLAHGVLAKIFLIFTIVSSSITKLLLPDEVLLCLSPLVYALVFVVSGVFFNYLVVILQFMVIIFLDSVRQILTVLRLKMMMMRFLVERKRIPVMSFWMIRLFCR